MKSAVSAAYNLAHAHAALFPGFLACGFCLAHPWLQPWRHGKARSRSNRGPGQCIPRGVRRTRSLASAYGRGERIVFAQGFGVADRLDCSPVTPQNLFASPACPSHSPPRRSSHWWRLASCAPAITSSAGGFLNTFEFRTHGDWLQAITVRPSCLPTPREDGRTKKTTRCFMIPTTHPHGLHRADAGWVSTRNSTGDALCLFELRILSAGPGNRTGLWHAVWRLCAPICAGPLRHYGHAARNKRPCGGRSSVLRTGWRQPVLRAD